MHLGTDEPLVVTHSWSPLSSSDQVSPEGLKACPPGCAMASSRPLTSTAVLGKSVHSRATANTELARWLCVSVLRSAFVLLYKDLFHFLVKGRSTQRKREKKILRLLVHFPSGHNS